MESVEKDCSVLGNLFQTIINDLRSSSPVWEDFIYKATKLHQCLKTTLGAIGAFLEAFQKVADMATNSKGATKEIGSALTRLCMRHKSIETCLKALTSSILDSLVAPLQEKLEDWKKVVAQLDKDHAKEYKKARQEIKKAASDTMRLQKKVKKGIPHGKNEMQTRLDFAMQDVNAKYQQLEEAEKNSVRMALIEERGRFCLFITCIKPFVDHEVHLLGEVTHLQEIMHNLCLQASEPNSLPASSEQVLTDLKGLDPATFNIQQPSPPSSPSSLGSRKSSMCSINSINSSSSGSSKSHSPSHTMHKRTASQPPMGTERLTSVSSQDSGFTSQDTLFLRPTTPQSLNLYQASNSDRDSTGTDTADCDSTPTTPSGNFVTTPTATSCNTNSLPHPSSTPRLDRNRPHTISAGSEKHYALRPSLKPELFEPLPEKAEQGEGVEMRDQGAARPAGKSRPHSTSTAGPYARPAATINKMQPVLPPHCPRPKVKAVPPPSLPPGAQPVYANTVDLQRMVMENQARRQDQDGEATTPTTPSGLQATQPDPPPSTDTNLNTIDLEEAIRSLDTFTAALVTDVSEEEVAAVVAVEREEVEKKEREEVEMRRSNRSQKMQQNSLELAAAIRELEESTAALQSTYDTASHTSHTSLQCSSGYATMNSTPSGSEDTIASGGVPASGTNLSRRSSVNTPKPPPPVRRTASITSTSSAGSNPRTSPPRQLSEPGTNGRDGVGQIEGPYAELQLIQQNIQQKKRSSQQPPTPPKPGSIQRQMSNEAMQQHQGLSQSPDRASISSGSSAGSSHYAVPNVTPPSPSQASLIQSLNAKFASLNQQYQEPPYQQGVPPNSDGATYIGGGGDSGDPNAASLMPPPSGPPGGQQGHHRGQGHGHDKHGGHHPHHQQGHPGHHQGHHGQGHHPGHPGHGYQPGHPGHGHQGHSGHGHQVHQGHGHHGHTGHGHQPGHPGPGLPGHGAHHPGQTGHVEHGQPAEGLPPRRQSGDAEDFPLPPTAEELAEMEMIYSKPPPVNPKPKMQANLMMELKRRVSHDEASDV